MKMDRPTDNHLRWLGWARISTLCLFQLFFQFAHAQKIPFKEASVTFSVNSRPLQEVFALVEQQVPFSFAYNAVLVRQQKKITLAADHMLLSDLLPLLLEGTSLSYSVIGNQIVLR